MKKNFLQDVVPANSKRSIRDIPLPSHKEERVSKSQDIRVRAKKREDLEEDAYEPIVSHATHHEDVREEEEEFEEEQPVHHRPKKTKSKGSKKLIYAFIAGIALVLIFMVSRTNAQITIVPKKAMQAVNVVIPLDGTTKLATKTQLSKTVSKTLPATSEQQVEKQASGKIKIINQHKETPQELVKNTRFQTSNGLIYRIRDSIVVPGYTTNGGTIVPGTLEVEVFADSAGEEYNTSNAKFTIPGFSGKEQFDKITAESVGDISGGYIGIRKVVSDQAKEQAQKDLEQELKNQFEQTKNESTEYVIVPDLNTLSYGDVQDKADGDNVILTLTARVDAYSFVKKDISSFIGQNSITGASTSDMFSLDTSKLNFSIGDESITISGTTNITYETDIEKLKKDFANKKRSEAMTIIDSYNSLEKAQADLAPFWKSKFPSDPSKIEVIVGE